MDVNTTIRNNAIEMLKNRGYVDIKVESQQNEYSIIATAGSFCSDGNAQGQKIIVYFPNEEKIGIKLVNYYDEKMLESSIYRCILIIKGSITSFAKDEIIKISQRDSEQIFIEIFTQDNLIIDIIKHKLIPKHSKLNKDEINVLLNKYSIKETQLPKMLITDPVSRYYGYRKLDVIKVDRISETAGYYTVFKVVV